MKINQKNSKKGGKSRKTHKKFEPKTFTNLEFYLWRIMYSPLKKWQNDIFIYGSLTAMKIILESLQAMLKAAKIYHHGTRKFQCNPPSDFNVQEYATGKNAKIQWLEWLIIKISPEISDNSQYVLQGRTVTITYNEKSLSQFFQLLESQINPNTQFPHGSVVPGGFYLAPDWLGAE